MTTMNGATVIVSVDVDDDIDNTKPAATQPNVVHLVGDTARIVILQLMDRHVRQAPFITRALTATQSASTQLVTTSPSTTY